MLIPSYILEHVNCIAADLGGQISATIDIFATLLDFRHKPISFWLVHPQPPCSRNLISLTMVFPFWKLPYFSFYFLWGDKEFRLMPCLSSCCSLCWTRRRTCFSQAGSTAPKKSGVLSLFQRDAPPCALLPRPRRDAKRLRAKMKDTGINRRI